MPGLIEVDHEEQTRRPGSAHGGLAGHEGEIAIQAWAGNPADPKTQIGGVKWILATDWVPYQLPTFVTPAFQGFASGPQHVQPGRRRGPDRLHRQRVLPGRPHRVHDQGRARSSSRPGPTTRHHDSSGRPTTTRRTRPASRGCTAGIHVQADDFTGRQIGSQCGKAAWALAQRYYAGQVQ